MHECASAESWPAAVSRAWRLQGQIDRALAWSDSQHGVRPASHRGLTLNSAQKGAKASRLNCRSAAVPHESDGARELRMALSGCVNRSSEPAASRKRSFRLPQTHRAKRRGQPANPERRRYLRADSFSGSQSKTYGTICAATFSATASGTPTRRSSTPVAMPGTPSWKNPTSSPQSEPENGHRSRFKAVGIRAIAGPLVTAEAFMRLTRITFLGVLSPRYGSLPKFPFTHLGR